MSEQQPTPVDQDANATAAELIARAAQDLANQQAAARKKAEQGGTGQRGGVLHGEGGH